MRSSPAISRRVLRVLPVAFLFFLQACAIQLAPAYNKDIVDAINTANTQTETLFASISPGVTAATFGQRENTYNDAIGQFSAIESQLRARPTPAPPQLPFFGSMQLPPDDVAKIARLTGAPSIDAMQHLIDNLTKMRDIDRQQGLPAANCAPQSGSATCLFENGYRSSLYNVLTYEMALER
jgi:hypothetical protein